MPDRRPCSSPSHCARHGSARADASGARSRRGRRGARSRLDPMPTRVAIVPHTHWDREWYSPFQTFRMRLVKLLDALLPMLERDLSYSRFLLDGQTAVLDDYLEVRPEAAATLERLAAAGRLVDRAVDGPHGRVHGLGRDDGARPPVRHGARRAARRRDGHRLPARHVRSRRADAAAAAARRTSNTRSCGAVCPRSSSRPRSGGRRPTVRACAPSTSTARTRTAATFPTTRSGSCCAHATTSTSSVRRGSATCC